MGVLRDPRLVAAVSGLVACSAAATVALTASDARVPAGAGDPSSPGPLALPAPGPTLPVPGPTLPLPDEVVPAPVPPPVLRAPESRPSSPPRARRAPSVAVPEPAHRVPARVRRSTPAREILDRLSAELAGSPDGVLVVPVQRDDDKKHEHKKKHGHDKKKHEHKKKHGHDKKKHDVAERCATDRVLWKKGAHPGPDTALLITRRHQGSGLTVRHVHASCALAALGRSHDRTDD